MIEFCAAVGRVCLDPGFHKELFDEAIKGREFQELDSLRALLKSRRVRLNRGDVMELHRLLTTDRIIPPPTAGGQTQKTLYTSENQNPVLNAIHAIAPDRRIQFPRDLELCAVVGLCCVDDQFREAFHTASNPSSNETANLRRLLVDGEGDSPGFYLEESDLQFLNQIIRSGSDGMMRALADFQEKEWVQPVVHRHFGACRPGYTRKPYKHLSPQETAIMFEVQEQHQQGTLKRDLFDAQAIF